MRAWIGMSSRWIATPKADSCPPDFDPRFGRPQPYQSKNRGADQDVQDWEEIWVPSWWLNDEFQEMKGDARNRDNLCARGGAFSNSVGNGKVSESLTKDMNWTKVFGRLNGVYPRAAFQRTVKAMYWTPSPSRFSSGHMLREGKK